MTALTSDVVIAVCVGIAVGWCAHVAWGWFCGWLAGVSGIVVSALCDVLMVIGVVAVCVGIGVAVTH